MLVYILQSFVLVFVSVSSQNGWTQIGTLGDIETLTANGYLDDHELGLDLNSLNGLDIMRIVLNSWATDTIIISYAEAIPCSDSISSFGGFCRVVIAKGLSSQSETGFYHYYYQYKQNTYRGGWGFLSNPNTIRLYSKPSNKWTQIGVLNDIITLMNGSYIPTEYEYGIKYNTALGSIHKVTLNTFNVGYRVSTVDTYPSGTTHTLLKFTRAVFTKGLQDQSDTNWLHHYYELDTAAWSNGDSNYIAIFAREINDCAATNVGGDYGWTDIGYGYTQLTDFEFDLYEYGWRRHQFPSVSDPMYQPITISDFEDNGLRISVVDSYPTNDYSTALQWGSFVVTLNLYPNPSDNKWWAYYYLDYEDTMSWNFNNYLTPGFAKKLINRWIYVGILQDIDTLKNTYSVSDYEYGVETDGSIRRVIGNSWNQGTRISTAEQYLIGNDSLNLHFGKTVFAKDLHDTPTSTDWYQYYFILKDDVYYKMVTNPSTANNMKVYIRKINGNCGFTSNPTIDPTVNPTTNPSSDPTKYPTSDPTADPTNDPTIDPTSNPTKTTLNPTFNPTVNPTRTKNPTVDPTIDPTIDPTVDPTFNPTANFTFNPTIDPTVDPTLDPTTNPTVNPTTDPTFNPTTNPTFNPTADPTIYPTINPSSDPTKYPTSDPTADPTKYPTSDPTADPTAHPTLYPTSVADAKTIFIDSLGIDFDECGTFSRPCGTIAFATALSYFSETFFNVSKIDVYVFGQNEEEIMLWKSDGKTQSDISFLSSLMSDSNYFGSNGASTPCSFYDGFYKSIEITFDVHKVRSMKDWFPDICFEYWQQTSHRPLFRRSWADLKGETINIFNNLIVNDINMDDFGVSMLLHSMGPHSVILNNCSFYNIYKTIWPQHAMIVFTSGYIYNTKFDNIILQYPSDSSVISSNWEMPTFVEISAHSIESTDDISLIMEHCSITNYYNSVGPFLLIYAYNVFSDKRRIELYNSSFSDINTTPSMIISSSFLKSWRITMNIISCTFLNINFGSVLFTQNAHSIYIQDVFISTKQRIQDLMDHNEYQSLISLFVFGDDNVFMKNITLKYSMDASDICVLSDTFIFNDFISLKRYNCYAPIQFVQNEGILHVSDFTISNDIKYQETQSQYVCTLLSLCEFKYHSSELDYALLSNIGDLIVDNCVINGVGLSYQFLLNKGSALIDNAIFEYYNNEFDPFIIHNHMLFTNDGDSIFGGILTINNSYLYGATYVAVQINKGSAYILNTVINRSSSAIVAFPDVEYLFVDNVKFINIGVFYTSYVSSFLDETLPPPLLISAQQSIISNSYFSFFDRYGFIVMSPEIFSVMFSIEISRHQLYDITLINNAFEINTNDTLMSLSQLQEVQEYLSGVNGVNQTLLKVLSIMNQLKSVRFDASSIFKFGCLLCFYPDTTAHLIGNIFYGSTMSDNTSFISIHNAPNINCISNNTIYGYALHLISGTVTSCSRNQLPDILQRTKSQCWRGGLGELSDINGISNFIASQNNNIPLILIESSESTFSAEKISFLMQSDSYISNAIEIISGTIFIFDVDLNEADILYHDNCNVNCFERLNGNDDKLVQLNINCDIDDIGDTLSLLIDTAASFKNHLNPYSVFLQPKYIYYPGGRLYLNHSIYDIFGDEITDYNQNITITLKSSPSDLNLQIEFTIDHNGSCEKCDEGIFIQDISTLHIGDAFSIEASIANNELEINAVTFNVSQCPSGFGKIGVAELSAQCGLCDIFHFSLSQTTDECFSCSNINEYSSNYGFECHGADSVIIDYNFWFSGVHEEEFISPLYINTTTDDTIYTSYCPPAQCCQSVKGCSYLDINQLCAINRDVNVPLCGLCIDGMYELYGTASCGTCNNMTNLLYLIPIFIATVILVIILMNDAKEVNPNDYVFNEVNFKRLLKKDEIQCLSIMISKVFLYYYQSLSQILYSKGIESIFSPILNTFDLSFGFSASSSGICIFPFISDPLLKIILNSIFIFFGFFHFIWIPVVMKVCNKNRKRMRISTESKSGIIDPLNENAPKNTFIYVSLLKLFVISCGTILTVAFKLLSCIIFPSFMAHFYNSNKKCFSGYWMFGFALLLFVLLSFTFIAFKIYKQTVKQRKSYKNVFRKMVNAYNEDEWWWEFILFSRRVIIALFTSIRTMNARDTDPILLSLLLIYVVYHSQKMPFKYNRLNVLETICLMVLILVFAIFDDDFTDKYTNFTDFFVSLAILLPIILVLYHTIKISIFISWSSSSTSFSELELAKIEKAKKRAPIIIDNHSNNRQMQIDDDKMGKDENDDEMAIPTANAVSTLHITQQQTIGEIEMHHGLTMHHDTDESIDSDLDLSNVELSIHE